MIEESIEVDARAAKLSPQRAEKILDDSRFADTGLA